MPLLEGLPESSPVLSRSGYVLAALAAIFFIATVVLLLRSQSASAPMLPEVRFEIFPPQGGSFTGSADYGTTAFPWPQISPDGRAIAFVATVDSKQMLWVRSLDSPTGHILFVRDFTLMAQPFDAKGLQLVDEAFPIAEQVTNNPIGGAAAFSVSQNGGIAYRDGGSAMARTQLAWFDRSGKQLGVAAPTEDYRNPELSPDVKYVEFVRGMPSDIWVLDLQKGLTSRFTTNPSYITRPLWSPDSRSLAFFGRSPGQANRYRKRVASDGGRRDQRKGGTWGPDGTILFTPAAASGIFRSMPKAALRRL